MTAINRTFFSTVPAAGMGRVFTQPHPQRQITPEEMCALKSQFQIVKSLGLSIYNPFTVRWFLVDAMSINHCIQAVRKV